MNKGVAGRFRNITNATKPWFTLRRRRGGSSGEAPDIRLTRRGRWKRASRTGRTIARAAVFLLFAAGVIALSIRIATSADAEFGLFYLLPFVLVGTVALWTSRLSAHAKLLWSIPLAAVLLAFVP